MDRRAMRRRMLAAALLAAGVVGGSAASAQASATRIAGTDSFHIDANNWDFGGKSFDDTLPTFGEPTTDGDVEWLLVDGVPQPHLTGYIHANKAKRTCGHMEIDYQDSLGGVIHTTNGGEVCADKATHKSWAVDLGTYSDPDIAKVTVKLHVNDASNGGDTVVAQHTSFFGPYLASAQVLGSGWDLGNNTWDGNKPIGSGTFLWMWDHGANGHLSGTLHANRVSGDCARVLVEYLNIAGGVVGSESTTVDTSGHNLCASGNSHQTFTIGLGGTVTSTSTVAANVKIQTLNSLGTYDTLSTQKLDFSTIYVVPS